MTRLFRFAWCVLFAIGILGCSDSPSRNNPTTPPPPLKNYPAETDQARPTDSESVISPSDAAPGVAEVTENDAAAVEPGAASPVQSDAEPLSGDQGPYLSANVIENGDFEVGPLQAPLVQGEGEGRGGGNAAILEAVGGKGAGVVLKQEVPLAGKSCYAASVWARVTAYGSGLLRGRIIYMDANRKHLRTGVLFNLNSTSAEWRCYSLSESRADWPKGAEYVAFYFGWLEADDKPPSGTVYLDDIRLVFDEILCL